MSVQVQGLRIELTGSGVDVVDGIAFHIAAGQVLGLVGESGSGKTSIGMAMLGYARKGARIAGGQVRVHGVDILSLEGDALRAARGRTVAYVPQDPGAALSPKVRVGVQLRELLDTHAPEMSPDQKAARIVEALEGAELPGTPDVLQRYPFEFSGGQQQRLCLAMAFLLRPQLVVLDEPTTGLDVVTQAAILATMRHLCTAHGSAVLYVSHDLATVASVADHVLALYAGRVAENGPAAEVFRVPLHPYTRRLLQAAPDIAKPQAFERGLEAAPRPGHRPDGCAFVAQCPQREELCDTEPPPEAVDGQRRVRCHAHGAKVVALPRRSTPRSRRTSAPLLLEAEQLCLHHGDKPVVHHVSLSIRAGECVALVGESGSGKTTLARALIGLHPWESGQVRFDGAALARAALLRSPAQRQAMQYIFQNPFNALNPRRTVQQILEAPLRQFGLAGEAPGQAVREAITRVSLPARTALLFPGDLSGGERQRVAIARALVCKPRLLICDEITSALDVSVQSSVLHLVQQLQREDGLALLFVTHDLAVARSLSDQVAVLRKGRIDTWMDTEALFESPATDYTRALIGISPRSVA